jgi:hypothetical protein
MACPPSVGTEVKASATLTAADFKGLRTLSAAAGDRFHRGILPQTGKESVPIGQEPPRTTAEGAGNDHRRDVEKARRDSEAIRRRIAELNRSVPAR